MLVDWLSPISSALDARKNYADIFFRDDDAGWNDGRLFTLLNCFSDRKVPVDLAVIPQATEAPLADALFDLWQQDKALLGIHQHGFMHINHELEGRKCEFGNNRALQDQFNDLAVGKERMEKLFGPALDPIFTPPWNRCTEATVSSLIDLKFCALSRNRTAENINPKDLLEIPVDIDWCGIRARAISPWTELGHSITVLLKITSSKPIGIMLHHAAMDDVDIEQLKRLLDLFSKHRFARPKLMREFLISH